MKFGLRNIPALRFAIGRATRHGDTEARRTAFFVLSLTLGRFGELSGNCPIRFLFSRMSVKSL